MSIFSFVGLTWRVLRKDRRITNVHHKADRKIDTSVSRCKLVALITSLVLTLRSLCLCPRDIYVYGATCGDHRRLRSHWNVTGLTDYAVIGNLMVYHDKVIRVDPPMRAFKHLMFVIVDNVHDIVNYIRNSFQMNMVRFKIPLSN